MTILMPVENIVPGCKYAGYMFQGNLSNLFDLFKYPKRKEIMRVASSL